MFCTFIACAENRNIPLRNFLPLCKRLNVYALVKELRIVECSLVPSGIYPTVLATIQNPPYRDRKDRKGPKNGKAPTIRGDCCFPLVKSLEFHRQGV